MSKKGLDGPRQSASREYVPPVRSLRVYPRVEARRILLYTACSANR
jgi:hypothetical protein